jgi:enoyl-CoA hydratase/carnithine racemase
MTLVLFEQTQDGIGTITLNDPDNLNAMSEAMAEEFSGLVAKLKQNNEKLKVLILTGSGRAFSAGGNLAMLEQKTQLEPEENRTRMLKFYDSFLSILQVPVPIIAAINGAAVGAGLCLASACDLRIAVDSAKMGFTFTKLGLHPGMGATYFLPRLLGDSVARELMLTGRIISAVDALRLGLVSQVVSSSELLSTVKNLANEILTCGKHSIALLLETLRSPSSNLSEALSREAITQSYCYAHPEFKEGVRAAIEKRPAKF